MRRIALLNLSLILVAGVAFAADPVKTVTVKMTGAQEVPPNDSKGSGTATFMLDPATKSVTWNVTWSGLTSPAIAAHIHGPAAPGINAGVVVNLAPVGTKSPLIGSAKMTDAQWADLMAGKDYVNVHTTDHKGGEIRGQITPSM